ncbi:hypothetical protein MHZ95_10045 [Sporosarcina sp. ACRSM]|uniref:hypothetical protein n=1 Tax=Sporosarcina sp. ACRSM TaxID=2918216 RepID=UPI001EF47F32|nr:hypothetical protein [Sporosarcina sp. ACRSM]MCG7335620.1 hypothetical protein [Sporosarcina sp. ACRSM]
MPSKLSNLMAGLGCLTPIVGIVLLCYFLFQSSISLGVISIVLSFVITILFIALGIRIEEKRKLKQLDYLQTFQPDVEDFHKLKSFTSYDLLTKIAIDDQHGKVYFWAADSDKVQNITKAYVGMPYIIKSYNYIDILAVRFTEDQHQTATVQRDTHFTHYLLNKLSKDKVESKNASGPPIDKISSMDLEIILNDNVKPRHLIRFYHEPNIRIRKDSPEYQGHYSNLQQWFTRLETIINETEESFATSNVEQPLEIIEPANHKDLSQEDPPNEKTQIMMDVDMKQYSLDLTEDRTELNPQSSPDDPIPMQAPEKPTSYFEQLIEKNKKQLRGDYSDE